MAEPRLQSAAPRLRVGNVQRAAEWYRDQLGFTIGEYFPASDGRPGFVIVERQSARLQLALIPAGEPAANPDGTTNPGGVYIEVSDIDALYSELEQRGTRLLYDIECFSYGMKEFAVLDCDGHYVGFGEPA